MVGISNILVVGGYDTFVTELVGKLTKEGARVFVLSGRGAGGKIPHAFEQYRFDYTGDAAEMILESCHPDVLIFTGAYDPVYAWSPKSRKTDARDFIAGLSNLLLAASRQHIGHFVYLSSECVFGESYVVDIQEDFPHTPLSEKGTAVSQGEKLALSFNQPAAMEVSVLRLANVYSIPKNDGECRDRYTKMCLCALDGGRLSINAKKISAPLYINDAVHAVFLLISAAERQQNVYQVSSAQEVSEYDIAQSIRASCYRTLPILDETTGTTSRMVLSGRLFQEEFQFSIHFSYSETIPQIMMYMQSHMRQFHLARPASEKWKKLFYPAKKLIAKVFPYLECLAVFPLIGMLNQWSAHISYLQGMDYFLLFVLIFAAICGQVVAVFAFSLSVIAYCWQQMQVESGLALLVSPKTYLWVVELFLVGMVAGRLRDQLIQMREDKDEEIRFLSNRMQDVTAINNSNARIKNYFEERVINSGESIGWFYNVISRLDSADNGEVVFLAAGVLTQLMKTGDVAIYQVSDDRFCRLLTATSARARTWGKSVDMHKFPEVFETMQAEQVFINRALDTNLPSLALSLRDGTSQQMQVILLLWDVGYEQMTLYYVNTFRVAGTLIHHAMLRSMQYMDALAYRRYIPGTQVLQREPFEEMHRIYRRAGQKKLTEFCMLRVETDTSSVEDWSTRLHALLRRSDLLGVLADGQMGILLTNTSRQEAQLVLQRLEKAGIHAVYLPEAPARRLPNGQA